MSGVIGIYPTCPIVAVCRAKDSRWCNLETATHRLEMPHDLARNISIASDCNMGLLNEPQRNMRRQILRTLCAANARQKILLRTLERRK